MIDGLTGPQRARLVELARAGRSLPRGDEDPALAEKRLVRRYRDVLEEEFADLTGRGIAAAHAIGSKG